MRFWSAMPARVPWASSCSPAFGVGVRVRFGIRVRVRIRVRLRDRGRGRVSVSVRARVLRHALTSLMAFSTHSRCEAYTVQDEG
eukprot:scaffold122252_cov45-Phaeocystis_antarctica.AAC.3